MVKVLFDTNILIDFLDGVPQAQKEWTQHVDRAISLITWMEVMTGVSGNKGELSLVKSFLGSFLLIPVDVGIASETVRLRKQKK